MGETAKIPTPGKRVLADAERRHAPERVVIDEFSAFWRPPRPGRGGLRHLSGGQSPGGRR